MDSQQGFLLGTSQMEVKFFAGVKFVCIKREFNIKKVYLIYSGFK